MPRDLSLFAAGEGSEHILVANYMLNLAQAGDEESEAIDEDAVAGTSETASPSRPKKPLYSSLVTVLVGPAQKPVLVHPALLSSVSPFVTNLLTGKAKEREGGRVHHVRHKLQRMLFPKKGHPGAKELAAADMLLTKLEGLGDLNPHNILTTRIHKVLKAALKSSEIPSFEQWRIKKRSHLLLTKYEERLKSNATTAETALDSTEDTIHLPNASEATFKLFIHWLYRKELASPDRSRNCVCQPLTAEELVELYTLADFLQVATLQNRVADKLESISPSPDSFGRLLLHAKTNHTEGSMLLALLISMYARHATEATIRSAAADWMEKDLLLEVTAVLLRDREGAKGKAPARKSQRCEYHVHNKANPPCN